MYFLTLNKNVNFYRGSPKPVSSSSPLSYSFDSPGFYNVRVTDHSNPGKHDAYCNVVVEEPIADVMLRIRPALRYVCTNDVIVADLSVEKGNNLTQTIVLKDVLVWYGNVITLIKANKTL